MKRIAQFLDVNWWTVVPLAGIAVFVLSMVLSIGQSIWFDEGYSIMLAERSTGDLLALTAVDAHPPLYYLVLQLWGNLFGFEPVAMRSLSAVFAGLAVVVMLAVISRMFGARVAVAAIPFLVLSPFLLRYGYEVRMYAMASLIGVLATYVLIRANESDKKHWWILYAVLVASGMYTLYMTIAIWLAHLVWLAVISIRKSKDLKFWRWRWVYAYLGAVGLFAPYIPTFVHQMTNSALPGIGSELTLTGLGNIITSSLLFEPEWGVGGWMSLLLGAVLVLIVVATVRAYTGSKAGDRKHLLLLMALVGVPILFFAATSLPPRAPIFTVRYIAHISIYIYALLGVAAGITMLAKSQSWKSYVMPAGLLLILAIGVGNLSSTGNFVFERMQKPMTIELRDATRCGSDTVAVADDPYTYMDSFMYFDDCNLRFYNPTELAMAGGYAPLRGSAARIDSADDIDSKYLVHIRWVGNETSFKPGEKYRMVDSVSFDKQQVDRYELIAE